MIQPFDPGETYYVIVGIGLTAAVNYTTLLAANRGRLKGLPVLLMGDDEPWSRYDPLRMGQWPSVLSPPSFRDKGSSVPQEEFLDSHEFAKAIEKQLRHL